MTKKLMLALALAVVLAVAATPPDVSARWGAGVLEMVDRVVAAGPFIDFDG